MMLTPCWPSAGPTGGAGVAWPAWICSLITAAIFFFGGMRILPGLVLLNLLERELNRRLPPEDLDQALDLLRVGVDLVDRRLQCREWPIDDGDRVTHFEVEYLDLRRRTLLLALHLGCQRVEDLAEGQRHRRVALPDESGHPGRVAYGRP